jgi:hypothetical protein
MPKPKEANADALNRIALLLAMLVIKDIDDTEEQALLLSAAGFNALEIASMLSVGPNYLNVIKHRRKSKKQRKRVREK